MAEAAAFDTQRASQALTALGQAIIEDRAYGDPDWDGLSVVGSLDGVAQMFGYVYTNAGDWSARAPDDFYVLDRFEDLRDAMRKPGEGDWKYCLIQIKRDGLKIHAEFDYGDGEKWKISPENLRTRVEELRPK